MKSFKLFTQYCCFGKSHNQKQNKQNFHKRFHDMTESKPEQQFFYIKRVGAFLSCTINLSNERHFVVRNNVPETVSLNLIDRLSISIAMKPGAISFYWSEGMLLGARCRLKSKTFFYYSDGFLNDSYAFLDKHKFKVKNKISSIFLQIIKPILSSYFNPTIFKDLVHVPNMLRTHLKINAFGKKLGALSFSLSKSFDK